jgi:hypothetical protein
VYCCEDAEGIRTLDPLRARQVLRHFAALAVPVIKLKTLLEDHSAILYSYKLFVRKNAIDAAVT